MASILEKTGTGYDDNSRDLNPEYETVWTLTPPELNHQQDLSSNYAPKKKKKGKRLKDWER